MSEPTALSLIPPLVVLVLAIWLRRPILSLIIGAVTGFLLLDPTQVLNNFASTSLKVMADETIGWLILVCGCFGALIALLVRTGGALAFGRNALKFAKGPRSSLFMTFILGIVIFIDDYLNALTVGETMKRVTDKFKVSREMLAYVVDSTAAPVCVLVPLSTWAVFFGGLLVDNGVAAEGQGISVYMQAIPYMLYAWLAVAMVLLVALGVVPAIGPMKKAELRAAKGEPAEAQVDLDQVQTSDEYAIAAIEEEFKHADNQGKLHNFLVPILLLVAFTVYFDIDVWKGLLATLVITLPYYAVQRLMPLSEMMDQMIDGFKGMLPAIGTVIAAFVFKDVCDQLLVVATANRQIISYDLSGPQPREHSKKDSPLKYQSRCVSAFPDKTGFAVGSIEGRVAIHYLQKVQGKDSFAFKCHRQENNVYAVNAIAFHHVFGLLDAVLRHEGVTHDQGLAAAAALRQPEGAAGQSPHRPGPRLRGVLALHPRRRAGADRPRRVRPCQPCLRCADSRAGRWCRPFADRHRRPLAEPRRSDGGARQDCAGDPQGRPQRAAQHAFGLGRHHRAERGDAGRNFPQDRRCFGSGDDQVGRHRQRWGFGVFG